MAFGDPLRVTGSGKEAHQSVVDFIGKNLSAWR